MADNVREFPCAKCRTVLKAVAADGIDAFNTKKHCWECRKDTIVCADCDHANVIYWCERHSVATGHPKT